MEAVFSTLLGPIAGIATAVITVMIAWNKITTKIALSENDRIALHKDIETCMLRITEHKKEDEVKHSNLAQDMVDLKIQLAGLTQLIEYVRESLYRLERAAGVDTHKIYKDKND